MVPAPDPISIYSTVKDFICAYNTRHPKVITEKNIVGCATLIMQLEEKELASDINVPLQFRLWATEEVKDADALLGLEVTEKGYKGHWPFRKLVHMELRSTAIKVVPNNDIKNGNKIC